MAWNYVFLSFSSPIFFPNRHRPLHMYPPSATRWPGWLKDNTSICRFQNTVISRYNVRDGKIETPPNQSHWKCCSCGRHCIWYPRLNLNPHHAQMLLFCIGLLSAAWPERRWIRFSKWAWLPIFFFFFFSYTKCTMPNLVNILESIPTHKFILWYGLVWYVGFDRLYARGLALVIYSFSFGGKCALQALFDVPASVIVHFLFPDHS